MTKKSQYICTQCGCVFEGKDIIVNLKERLGKDSFKSFLQNPFNRLSEMMGKVVCPECGSDKVMEVDEKTETELQEYMATGWDSSLLSEYFDPSEKSTDSSEEKSRMKDFVGKVMGFFNGKLNDFKEKYNQSDLLKKIASVAKKAGASTVYHVLLLFYALKSDEVPASKKVIVMAALGYFISPVDFIPDFVPLGLIDDGSVLLYAINQILPFINEDMKAKALAKLNEWFGKTDIISIKSQLLPQEVEVIDTEIIEDNEISEKEESITISDNFAETKVQKHNNMEITAPYKEVTDYIAERFHQQIDLSCVSEKEIKVSYTKRVFINVNVSVVIKIEEVKADSILLAYTAQFGFDSIISGVLSFIAAKYPELSAGIHPEDGHRIRINLSEIEKAKALVENIALRNIKAYENCLRIEFALKVPSTH